MVEKRALWGKEIALSEIFVRVENEDALYMLRLCLEWALHTHKDFRGVWGLLPLLVLRYFPSSTVTEYFDKSLCLYITTS